MQYGICIWSLPGSLEERFALCKKAGIHGVSLGLEDVVVEKRENIKRLLQKYELEFPTLGVNALCGTGMSKVSKEKQVFEILEEAIDSAVAMNVEILQLPSFMDGDIIDEVGLIQTIKCLKFVCERALPHGILVGHESTLSVEEIRRVLEEVNCKNLFVYYDSANYPCMKGTDPIPVLETFYENITQLHVKDSYKNPNTPLQLGDGLGEIPTVLKILKNREYDGWIILESQYNLYGNYEAILHEDIEILKNNFI